MSQNNTAINIEQEFYIPMESNSIHFLRSKLCVGGARGFEIVSLETLETQSLLDQADTSLDFVVRRDNVKPIYIERTPSEFLLCYTDFSFFVNKNGWRARNDWKITWEGQPTAFATWGDKYILALEQDFIEVRLTENGQLVCVLTAKNIRFLHSSSREVSPFHPQCGLVGDTNQLGRYCMHTRMRLVRMSLPVWIFGDDQCRRLDSRARHSKTNARVGDGNGNGRWMYDHATVTDDSEERNTQNAFIHIRSVTLLYFEQSEHEMVS